MDKNTDMLVKDEIKRLKGIFSILNDRQKQIASNLISEVAFMKVALQGLKNEINQDGPVDIFTQGPNTYKRQHPALSGYNALVKNYTAAVKQLMDLIPKDQDVKIGDALARFNAEIEHR